MTGDAARRVFRCGIYEPNEDRGELRKHGLRIKLHSQPFQVLIMLLERPSTLVTREEMRRRLWGDDTFVDFDHGLNSAVNKIREALQDSASLPRYVETVPGKGYRFIAPVSQATERPAQSERPATEAIPALLPEHSLHSVLSTAEELPATPRKLIRILLLLVQLLYLSFYLIALANLREVDGIFAEARLLPPSARMTRRHDGLYGPHRWRHPPRR